MSNATNPYEHGRTETPPSHLSHSERKHAEQMAAIRAKEYSRGQVKLQTMGEGVLTGIIAGHAVFGVTLAAKVVIANSLHSFATATTNFAQVFAGSVAGKRVSWAGPKQKKQKKPVTEALASGESVIGGAQALVFETGFDKAEEKLRIPNVTRYEMQGRNLTSSDRTKLAAASVLRAAIITIPVYAVVHYAAHRILGHSVAVADPVMPLRGIATAAQAHTSQFAQTLHNSPLINQVWEKVRDNATKSLPDKLIGLTGLVALAAPFHLSTTYRLRRVACRIVDQQRLIEWGPMQENGHRALSVGPKRTYHRRLHVLWHNKKLWNAIHEELNYRDQKGANLIKPGQLTFAQAREIRREMYGHRGQQNSPAVA